MISAGLIGAFGLLVSPRGALAAVFPSILGNEALAFVAFPGLRITGLLVGLASTAANCGLLLGVWRTYSGAPDGLPILWGSIRLLAAAMVAWVVVSGLLVMATGNPLARGPVLGGLLTTGLLAAIQIAVVMLFVRRALKARTAQSLDAAGGL